MATGHQAQRGHHRATAEGRAACERGRGEDAVRVCTKCSVPQRCVAVTLVGAFALHPPAIKPTQAQRLSSVDKLFEIAKRMLFPMLDAACQLSSMPRVRKVSVTCVMQVKRVVVMHRDGGVGFDWVSSQRQRLCVYSRRTHHSSVTYAYVDFWHGLLTLKCWKRKPYVCETQRRVPVWTLPAALCGHRHLFDPPRPLEQTLLEEAMPDMFVFADGTQYASTDT